MRAPVLVFGLLLAGMLACPGCGLLSPREDTTQYAVLASLDEIPGAQAPAASANLSSACVGLGPVTLPEYLKRPQIVSRVEGTRIVLSGTERWAEPLDQALLRVLAIDLARTMGAGRVVNYPWYECDAPGLQVEIAFSRCERDETGKVVIAARWSLSGIEGAGTPIERESRIEQQATGHDGASTALALSRGLAELCREIAGAVPASSRGTAKD
jgi:uncharacterized lipoprotein YmbA